MNTQNQILTDAELDGFSGGAGGLVAAGVRWVVSRVAAKGIIAAGDKAIEVTKEAYRETVAAAARALPRPKGL